MWQVEDLLRANGLSAEKAVSLFEGTEYPIKDGKLNITVDADDVAVLELF